MYSIMCYSLFLIGIHPGNLDKTNGQFGQWNPSLFTRYFSCFTFPFRIKLVLVTTTFLVATIIDSTPLPMCECVTEML